MDEWTSLMATAMQDGQYNKLLCKLVASSKMFCPYCKGILDQRSVKVAEINGSTIGYLCGKHEIDGQHLANKAKEEVSIYTWKGEEKYTPNG